MRTHLQDTLFPNVQLQEVKLKLVKGAESNLLQIFLAQGMSHGHRELWMITGYTHMIDKCKRIPDI
jgi:hypothetical protein